MRRAFLHLLLIPLVGTCAAQPIVRPSDLPCSPADTTNSVRPLASDSLCSSFIICIPRRVAPHLHRYHTEHVVVLDGTAEMLLGDSLFPIASGQVIVIPKGTPHAVRTTSSVPLRVISVQSPRFDGSDRVLIMPR